MTTKPSPWANPELPTIKTITPVWRSLPPIPRDRATLGCAKRFRPSDLRPPYPFRFTGVKFQFLILEYFENTQQVL